MTKVKAIETTDGQIFKSIEEAQKHELCLIISKVPKEDRLDIKIADALLESRELVVSILTMKASSHPAARKANGAAPRKPRAAKATPATNPPQSEGAA